MGRFPHHISSNSQAIVLRRYLTALNLLCDTMSCKAAVQPLYDLLDLGVFYRRNLALFTASAALSRFFANRFAFLRARSRARKSSRQKGQ